MSATKQTEKKSVTGSERSSKTSRLSRTQLAALLKALADPKRFELLERIAKSSCPLGCTDAREALDIAPATLSHHIKELQSSGLIEVRREGKFHFLTVRPGVLEALASTLQALSPSYCNSR
jgi:ArsR family transcriptional regulator, arsenate/arsenite/antimonite-responsive transcriptional repressor